MQLTPDQSSLDLEYLKTDPVGHIQIVQGVESLEKYQERIAESVCFNQYTSVAACHDVGKTFIAARIVLWFGGSFSPSKVITTAPTFNQVKQLLWSEIRSGHAKSKIPLGGEMLTTQWKISEDWYAIGFTSRPGSSDSLGQGEASSFQGFHSPHILVVFDEATGIPPSIWKQLTGIMTSGFVRFLAIGNPTSKSSAFYQTFKSFKYHKIYISCFDSPNLPANGIRNLKDLKKEVTYVRMLSDEQREKHLQNYKIVNSFLLTLRWVVEQAIEWGFDHPLFISKALGQFPDEDEHALFPLGIVEEAIRKEPSREKSPIAFGVDVARFGSDKTVIHRMDGANVTYVKKYNQKDTQEVAGEVIALINACPRALDEGCTIGVDVTGVGGGVVDALNHYKQSNREWRKVVVLPVDFASAFNDPKQEGGETEAQRKKQKYLNRKAEIFLLLALDLKTNLKLLDESDYLKELPVIIYRFNAKGQYVMESKDEFRTRTGLTSPDVSDSLAICNFARHQSNYVHALNLPDIEKLGIKPIAGSLESEDW